MFSNKLQKENAEPRAPDRVCQDGSMTKNFDS